MDAGQKLQYLQDITGLADQQQCVALLEAHDWDLDSTVGTALAMLSGESREDQTAGPSSAVQGGLRARTVNSATATATMVPGASPGVAVGIGNPSLVRNSSTGRLLRSQPQLIQPRPTGPLRRFFSFPFLALKRTISMMSKILWLSLWASGTFLSFALSFIGSLATWAAGGAQPYARIAHPTSDSRLFKQFFEEEYGSLHPEFVDLSFMEAVRRAEEQFKFLFVYIHSSEHSDTAEFCKNTLCSQPVIDFLRENFVTWAGDVRSREGFQIGNSLKAPTFPFCAVVTSSSHQRVALLQQVEGPVSPETLVTLLQRVLEEQGATLVAARAEAEERQMNRRLREEQDAAYEAALREDQERERKLREEAERQKRELEEAERKKAEEEALREAAARQQAELEDTLQRRREEKAASLGSEPQKGPNVTQVLVRLPGGERKERRFANTTTVDSVYDFVDSLGLLKTTKYTLVSSFPRVVCGPEVRGQSLLEAGLHPHANLFVQEHET